MTKDTAKILEELSSLEDFQTIYSENEEYMIKVSMAELLTQLLDKK